MYLNIQINLFVLLTILFCFKAELPPEYITCVSDFILLNKQLKSIYFPEKNEQWKVQRVILQKSFKDFEINKEEMTDFMGNNYANNCFELNKELGTHTIEVLGDPCHGIMHFFNFMDFGE
uniref:Uncharacterized protein n=1 Tax=Meloidogyne hapla TaxID=6305 RepID=A0A1I8C2K5_MELHA